MVIQSLYGLMEGVKDIAEFHKILKTADSFFDPLVQQDAHEALLHFLDVLHLGTMQDQSEELGLTQLLSQSSQIVTSAVKSTFQGSFKVTSECLQCLKRNTSVETFQEVPVDYYSDVGRAVKNSLVVKVEKFCQSCSYNTHHCISKTIWQQPKITIVRINRFKQMSSGRFSKNHNKIGIPGLLSLDSFKGQLIGVISHIGSSLSSGHYVSYVSMGSKWYRCSDENVTELAFSEFSQSGESYILFYQTII